MQDDEVSWRATPYRAPVLDSRGDELGRTASLLGDDGADIFHGLAVRLSHGGRVVDVPAARIVRITPKAVLTDVRPDEVGSLEPYQASRWFHLGWGGLFRQRPEWEEDDGGR